MNSDGFDDIAVSSVWPRGTYVFFGGDPADGLADLFLKGRLGAAEPIDLNGDGIDDVITADVLHENNTNDTGIVYFYKGYGDSLASEPFDSLIYPSNRAFGYGLHTAFVDSDSLGDFIAFDANTLGGGTFYYFSGCPQLDCVPDWTYKITGYSHYPIGESGQALTDVTGDEIPDIILGLSSYLDSVGKVLIFNGPDFDSLPDLEIYPPIGLGINSDLFAQGVFAIGDLDSDGNNDFGVSFGDRGLIYRGGPMIDGVHDYVTEHWAPYMRPAGDINSDGFSDLITSGTSRSIDGSAEIYLGGPRFDRYVDDYVVRADLPPLFLDHVGHRVGAAGDFNGDGVDDFMLSCQNFIGQKPRHVFVFKGSQNILVSIDQSLLSELPASVLLFQNYPNPFNPSTTIRFALPIAGNTELLIYNMLGEKVKTLIDRRLAAGSYTLEWDGTNATGDPVASGVYVYRLTSASL